MSVFGIEKANARNVTKVRRRLLRQLLQQREAGYGDARFRSYVSAESLRVAKVADSLPPLSHSELFSGWSWQQIPAPGAKHGGIRWAWRRAKFKRFMQEGGVLVVIGRCRSGKTTMLEKIMPGRVIENFRHQLFHGGAGEPARIRLDDIPTGIFAIDEAANHNRGDILRAVDKAVVGGRGLALVFQQAKAFRTMEIAHYLARQKVLFLEFSE